jgi:hypothetical protein
MVYARFVWRTRSQLVSLELSMLTAMILICSLASTPNVADCSSNNAIDIVWVPETFSNPVTCFMHGQAYIAGTSIGQNLTDNERVRVMCVRRHAASADDTTVAFRRQPAR